MSAPFDRDVAFRANGLDFWTCTFADPTKAANRLLLEHRGHVFSIAPAIAGFTERVDRSDAVRSTGGAAASPSRRSLRRLMLNAVRFAALALLLSCGPVQAAEPTPADAVRSMLHFQQDAWNRADIDAFMSGYWHDDSIRFAGGDAFRYGWQATIDRYRKTYPDAATMGRLDFDLLEVRELSPAVVYVFGTWHLARAQDPAGKAPHGLFTLIVEKKDDAWVITRDHTSAAAE
jgi:uncharacterized protein (TIGR02246 family)